MYVIINVTLDKSLVKHKYSSISIFRFITPISNM